MTDLDDAPGPTALQVLSTLLRSQPASRTELAAIRGLPTRDLDATIEQLVQAGFLEVDGEILRYPSPYAAVQARARALADLVAVLPDLGREWLRGAATASALDVELVHGHQERDDDDLLTAGLVQ